MRGSGAPPSPKSPGAGAGAGPRESFAAGASSGDALGLQCDAAFARVVELCAKAEGRPHGNLGHGGAAVTAGERVLFSDTLVKINRKDKCVDARARAHAPAAAAAAARLRLRLRLPASLPAPRAAPAAPAYLP